MLFSESDRMITLIHYGQEDQLGKETLAYATAEGFPIRDIDTSHTKVTETQWVELADKTGIQIKDLINPDHPNYRDKFSGEEKLDDTDVLKLLEHNPDILKKPIAIRGHDYKIIHTAEDIAHLHPNK